MKSFKGFTEMMTTGDAGIPQDTANMKPKGKRALVTRRYIEINGKRKLQCKESSEKKEACWDSHKQVGMKKKGGKTVPNCVPKEEVQQVDELSIKTLSKYNDKASKDPKRAKGSNMSVRKIVKKTMRGEGRNSDLKSPELSEEKDYFIKGLDLGDVKAKFVRRGKSMSSPIFIKVTASDTGKSHEMGPYRKIDIARKELSKMHESTIIEGLAVKSGNESV